MGKSLSYAEAELINEGKALAEQCGAFIKKLRRHDGVIHADGQPALPAIDQRWVSMGSSDLQVGFMKLTRAIERPDTF